VISPVAVSPASRRSAVWTIIMPLRSGRLGDQIRGPT
jgi:hypothetical protein